MTCSKEESFVGKNEREKKVFIPVTYFASYHKFVVRWTSKDIFVFEGTGERKMSTRKI